MTFFQIKMALAIGAFALGSVLSVKANATECLPGEECKPEEVSRSVCFNLYCRYQTKDKYNGYKKCRTAARFFKEVGINGEELEDRSEFPFNSQFQVECDGDVIFNGSAYRYTDPKGTRLQAQAGPFPATLLPRGSLRDGNRYVLSILELEEQSLKGYCYLYTGDYRSEISKP